MFVVGDVTRTDVNEYTAVHPTLNASSATFVDAFSVFNGA